MQVHWTSWTSLFLQHLILSRRDLLDYSWCRCVAIAWCQCWIWLSVLCWWQTYGIFWCHCILSLESVQKYCNSLSPAPRAVDVKTSTTKKNRKKLRYFRLPPNLAHRKLIALANYVLSSSPLRVLSFTQRFFKNVEKWRCVVRSIWDVFA